MTQTQQNLLLLLSHALFGKSADVAITPDILAEAETQAVSTLITDECGTLAFNILVAAAHAELTEVLRGIPFTTLKGCASAYYYPEPLRRPMGDVDFYVAPEYYEQAAQHLEAAGFQRKKKEHDRHESFYNGRVLLELHSEIKGIPNGADGIEAASSAAEKRVRELCSDLIETAVTVQTQQGPIIIPDDFHHGLIMLLHVAGHMINDGGVGLRHLCDWAAYVNKVDMEQFRVKLESVGLWTFACQLTAVCTRYLGLPAQSWMGEWDELFLQQLMEDIFAAGNFGQKTAGRIVAMALKKSSFAAMTKKRYPQAEKPLLLPFFMAVNLLRYGKRILLGERKPIKLSTLASAKEREELYRQFHLFEA